MSAKLISYGGQARNKIQRGIDILADTVKPTLGPRSRCVILGKSFGYPVIINDGATIAKEIELKDHLENIGVKMVREVASKTNDIAGDGTTTAILLARSICREGLKMVAAQKNPMALKRGMDKAVEAVVAELNRLASPVQDRKEIVQVGTISANNDSVIGLIIAQAMDKVGQEGVITVEESKGLETNMEIVEGMQFDRGYLSPYFITDLDKRTCELVEPLVIVHQDKISSIRELVPLLEKILQQSRSLLVLAEDVTGEALATLVVNKLRGSLSVCAVKAPGFGDRRKALLQDLAVLTGAQVISKELGKKLANVGLEVVGQADKIVITKDQTTVIGGGGKQNLIQGRISQIRKEIEQTTSDYDREKLQERLAKLVGGVAVLKIGAATETEMKEKKSRVEDAINATRAAVEEGIIPGGGVAFIRCLKALEKITTLDYDEAAGVKVVAKALAEPLRQIALNAGYNGDLVVGKVKSENGNVGFNALTEVYEDLVLAGVIDPKKVARTALQNAASIAGLLLTTDVAVTIKPKNNEPKNKV